MTVNREMAKVVRETAVVVTRRRHPVELMAMESMGPMGVTPSGCGLRC